MKKFFLLLFILILIFQLPSSEEKSNDQINQIFTTLVIIEEKENDQFAKETFFSDGVFNALWDKENCIFFDIAIEKPLQFFEDILDIKPFMGEARSSGADSILLIKFDYITEEASGKKLKIKIDECVFNLYSMNALKSIRSGKKSIKLNEVIEPKDKQRFLTDLGYKVLNDIYK